MNPPPKQAQSKSKKLKSGLSSPNGQRTCVVEQKGFFIQDSLEDDLDLPYDAPTIPLEKSSRIQLIPVKDRCKQHLGSTSTVQRPRCASPMNPTSINDYILNNTSSPGCEPSFGNYKIKINLPREDSICNMDDRKSKVSKSCNNSTWTSFASQGLKNPKKDHLNINLQGRTE